MHQFYKTLLVAVLPLVALLPACKKGESANSAAAGFKMYNPDTMKIHLDLYRNWDDYVTGENIYTSFYINAKDSVTIPASKLDAESTYYFDWYNSDYTHNNWVANQAADISFTPVYSSYHNCFSELSYVRKSLLSSNQTETHWAAADVYNQQGISVYDTLPANQKVMELTFQKNWTATLRNSQYPVPITCRVGVFSDGPIFQIDISHGGFLVNTKKHTLDNAAFQPGQETTDSLLYQYASFYYLLVKK